MPPRSAQLTLALFIALLIILAIYYAFLVVEEAHKARNATVTLTPRVQEFASLYPRVGVEWVSCAT